MNEMYERIEDLCKKKGINMTQMCKEAGIPRGNLSDLKYGRTAVLSTKSLSKISDYFGVPMNLLLGIEEIDPKVFAANLNRHMTINSFEVEEMSERTDIPINVLNELMAGARSPRKDEIDKLTMLLNIEKEDLTDAWTEPTDGEGTYSIEFVDLDTYDIVGKYRSLSPAQKRTVRQVIETILWGAPGNWKY